jgi:FeS assembly SUF system protein
MSDEYKHPQSIASLPVVGQPVSAPSPAPSPADPIRSIEDKLLEGKIIEALRQVYDPEIPVNIYELGLSYGVEIAADRSVKILMTLTSPGCPVAGSLPGEVQRRVEAVDEVKEAEVVLVWEPPWDKSKMSEAAQLQLGLF